MELHTKRLILRAAKPSDLNDLFALYSDPKTMAFWSTAPHADPSVTQKTLDYQIAAAARQLTYFVIAKDGRVIGNAGLHARDEIGFLLRADFWRQGIMKEALEAIISYLFENTPHQQLTADADPLNTASVGILKSIGFSETHRAKDTFCIEGVWSDSVYFALTRADWSATP